MCILVMSQTVVGNISLIYHNISTCLLLAMCPNDVSISTFPPVSLGSVMLGLGCRISLQAFCGRHITKIHQETREWHIESFTHTYIYYIMICISWFLSTHDMVLYGIVLTYVISQHHQTYTQGLELPQDRQGFPHDLISWIIRLSFPYE